jgi:mono/diheme cytochrome c family protein
MSPSRPKAKRWRAAALSGVLISALIGVLLATTLAWQGRDEPARDPDSSRSAAPADAQTVQQGAYLARAGNCMACHTSAGAPAYSGGRGIETPFGTVYAGNLTPDLQTGIGRWSADDFWRALREGRSRDGRLLYPAFPYANYSVIRREDSDAMFAYLRSLTPVHQPNRAHDLRWPFNTQAALAFWRALYFEPGQIKVEAQADATLLRGAYLVQGLGHCSACHSARNALGASNPLDLAGGLIPMQNWYAPSLNSREEAGVMHWPLADIVALLKTGVSARGSAQGPMAEVVLHSTQHLSEADLQAIGVFLQRLPEQASRLPEPAPPTANRAGAALYDKHCVQCHGEQGQGVPGAYPALAGNRAVGMAQPVNLVQMVLHGGYAPATAGNPRPFGMPPYIVDLSNQEIADLLSHLRSSWGHSAGAVSAVDVQRSRAQQGR